MDSIKSLYKIGNGPSSSHTMGPKIAATIFKEKNKNADRFDVELYGSLAATGKGHLTDFIIKVTLGFDVTNVIFSENIVYKYHTNAMKFKAFEKDKQIDEWLVFSVGGGELREENENREVAKKEVYPHKNMREILRFCNENQLSLLQYILKFEEKDILNYCSNILDVMFEAVERGIKTKGTLPGKLKVERKANSMYESYLKDKSSTSLEFASSLAVAEENAAGGIIVTAPTCGSSGVVPGALYPLLKHYNFPKEKLVEGLIVGGLIGNIIKHNGSISGAEVGCQGEIGVACSIAAAAITHIKGGSNEQIEYASEIALEHHLGLTCDPIMGYVQIPCVERNAISCKRAYDASKFAMLTDGEHYIKLDDAIKTMLETGQDLNPNYKETSIGGLAKHQDKIIC